MFAFSTPAILLPIFFCIGDFFPFVRFCISMISLICRYYLFRWFNELVNPVKYFSLFCVLLFVGELWITTFVFLCCWLEQKKLLLSSLGVEILTGQIFHFFKERDTFFFAREVKVVGLFFKRILMFQGEKGWPQNGNSA